MTGSSPAVKDAVVSLVKGPDRREGVPRAVALLGINPFQGRKVLIKPNFNTSDPFPASTHNETLSLLIKDVRQRGASAVAVGDRSGPVDTGRVLKEKGVDRLCADLGVDLINFEELPSEDWTLIRPAASRWRKGFDFARPVLEAESVVLTGCLKTHRFGGVFTMSLKLSVGMVHQKNMAELHSSILSMRKMIAEVNAVYRPDLVLLDGMEAFVDGGPMEGTRRKADVILAGTDRVAVDAVGLAVLRSLGTTRKIMGRPVFQQEQIAHAVKLGLGVTGPERIRIVTDDRPSEACADRLREILRET